MIKAILYHLTLIFLASFLVYGTLIIFKEPMRKHIYGSFINVSKDFVMKSNYDDGNWVDKTLQHYLDSGKIVVFGSSEITNKKHRFIPYNYFNKELSYPLSAFGHAGFQSLSIAMTLATFKNELSSKNARVVIILSPGWFTTDGLSLESFMEFMPDKLIEKLYFNKHVSTGIKREFSKYIKDNIHNIKSPNPIHYFSSSYDDSFINILKSFPYKVNSYIKTHILGDKEEGVAKSFEYQPKGETLDWSSTLKIAKEIENSKSSNNEFGINDEYFTKYIKKNFENGDFPYVVKNKNFKDSSIEFSQFLALVRIAKLFDRKPLFIMQNLNRFSYKNLDKYHPALLKVKKVLQDNNLPYLDLWSYSKDEYIKGSLTDTMHMGEYDWVRVNKAIYSHFIEDKK